MGGILSKPIPFFSIKDFTSFHQSFCPNLVGSEAFLSSSCRNSFFLSLYFKATKFLNSLKRSQSSVNLLRLARRWSLFLFLISLRISLVSHGTFLERTVTTLKDIHCLAIFVSIFVKRSVHSSTVLPVVTFSQSILDSKLQNFSQFNLL